MNVDKHRCFNLKVWETYGGAEQIVLTSKEPLKAELWYSGPIELKKGNAADIDLTCTQWQCTFIPATMLLNTDYNNSEFSDC